MSTSYVLMVNHFHLVIETPEPNLARGTRWLNGSYACYFNKRHRKVGHLFGERYKAIHAIRDEHGGQWREVAAWLGVHEGMRRLRVIAQSLRLRSCSRVTQLVRSCERRLRIDADFRRLVGTLQLALS